jgi:hypothetical protein
MSHCNTKIDGGMPFFNLPIISCPAFELQQTGTGAGIIFISAFAQY